MLRIDTSKKDKILGMLIGLYCGDALGATLEFRGANPKGKWQTEIEGGGAFDWNPGDPTDDTQMMLMLLRSFVNTNQFDVYDLKKRFIKWLKNEPKDVGNTIAAAISNMQKNDDFKGWGLTDESSQGNGSLMRCAPLAILDGVTDEIVMRQTSMTHAHLNCQKSDVIFIHALKEAMRGIDKKEIYDNALKRSQVISKDLYEALCGVPNVEWEDLVTSGWVVDSLACAFWALLKFDNFEDALIAVINRGDDSDTCGAIAGALLGAVYGVDAIPKRWKEKLHARYEIYEILGNR